MIPLIRNVVRALLWDELSAVRWLRGATLALAGGGVAFGDAVAEALGSPGAGKWIKLGAAAAAFAGGAITAGERNPR